jgi:hypothetical protein
MSADDPWAGESTEERLGNIMVMLTTLETEIFLIKLELEEICGEIKEEVRA